MRALLSGETRGTAGLAIGELPLPEPGPGEVRIRVGVVGVNFPDLLITEDRYQFRPERPFAPGGEVAGTIDAVGEGVTALKPGDRVLAMIIAGGMAEYIVVSATRVHPIPDTMPLEDAASLMLTYGTVLHALVDRADLRAGETLLVPGAAGGVGIAAVELGKALGARVIAAASSQEKLDLALARGADDGIVYPSGSLDKSGRKALTDAFKDKVGADGAHVILDPVGGDYAEPALRSIAWHGRYLVVGFPAGIPAVPFNLPLLKACQIIGVFFGGELDHDPALFGTTAARLIALHGQGKFKPTIAARYPLEEGAKAIDHLAARRALGKVVVTIDS